MLIQFYDPLLNKIHQCKIAELRTIFKSTSFFLSVYNNINFESHVQRANNGPVGGTEATGGSILSERAGRFQE